MKHTIINVLLIFSSFSLYPADNKNIEYVDSILTVARRISSQDIPASQKLLDEAFEISINLGHLSGKAEAVRLMGLLKFFVVDYPAALELFLNSKEIYTEANDIRGQARATNNIAVLYDYQNMHDKALEIYDEVIILYESINDILGLAGVYNNAAGIYRDKNDISTALKFYKKSLDIHAKKNYVHKTELSRTLNNIGLVFIELNEPDSSIVYLEKALEIRKEINEVQGIKNTYQAIGKYYNHIGELESARSYLEKSLDIAQQIGITYEIESAAQMLFPVYKELGLYEEAFNILLLYNKLRENTQSSEIIRLITSIELEARFEKEQEFQRLLQEEKEYKQNQLMDRQIRVRNTLIVSVLVLAIIVYLIYRSYRIKQKHVGILNTQKKEIIEKNEELKMNQQEILAQRDEIEKQNNMLESYNYELQNANKKMVDSIQYAETLQKTILPYESSLNNFCKDFFIIYKPCEIVSGDFYWYEKVNGVDVFALADCTGHGVPGALMTMIATGAMKNIILNDKCKDPACALEEIHKNISDALKQHDDSFQNLEGMDIALLYIDTNNKKLTYSGASIPIYLQNPSSIEKIIADKGSIGGLKRNKDINFTNKEFSYKNGMKLYLCTDGYFDQMNTDGKKIGRKRFEELLDLNKNLPFIEQKGIFEKTWTTHKSNENQIDDMTLIAIEL